MAMCIDKRHMCIEPTKNLVTDGQTYCGLVQGQHIRFGSVLN